MVVATQTRTTRTTMGGASWPPPLLHPYYHTTTTPLLRHQYNNTTPPLRRKRYHPDTRMRARARASPNPSRGEEASQSYQHQTVIPLPSAVQVNASSAFVKRNTTAPGGIESKPSSFFHLQDHPHLDLFSFAGSLLGTPKTDRGKIPRYKNAFPRPAVRSVCKSRAAVDAAAH